MRRKLLELLVIGVLLVVVAGMLSLGEARLAWSSPSTALGTTSPGLSTSLQAYTHSEPVGRSRRREAEAGRPDTPPRGASHNPQCYRWPKVRHHAERIDGVMRRLGGPLSGFGHEIACAGKRHGVSPYLIIAIAGTESTFGKAACGYNAWGLGSCIGSWSTRFASYFEAIEYVARLLGERYVGRGLHSVESIGAVYAASSRWPATTRAIMAWFTPSTRVTW